MKNNLEINALDTLFFKDGKPFSMGDESWAEGVFPPNPSVLSGALRSVWFADHMDQFQHANQVENDPSLALRLTGYLPCLNEKDSTTKTAAFPIPLDLYGRKNEAEPIARALVPVRVKSEFISDFELGCYFETQEFHHHQKAEKVDSLAGKALLTQAVFESWLKGDSKEFAYKKLADYLSKEPKVGIGRNPETRTADHGKLYRLSMNRLEGEKGDRLGFVIRAEGLELPDKGLMRIGAESRAAEYSPSAFPDIKCPVVAGANRFKLYLATPAIFPEGAVPTSWFDHHGLKLIACANGRTAHIGGFDMEKRRPKPMRKAVPAGTVYYLECVNDGGLTRQLLEQLHQGNIYHLAIDRDQKDADNLARQGFGLSFIGNINL
jgi:CRISPR-associated protein Cmr3